MSCGCCGFLGSGFVAIWLPEFPPPRDAAGTFLRYDGWMVRSLKSGKWGKMVWFLICLLIFVQKEYICVCGDQRDQPLDRLN